MRLRLNNPKIKFYIGDVRDRSGVDQAMKGVDVVFHAAALKQVPSCEFFPMQAVMTNILAAAMWWNPRSSIKWKALSAWARIRPSTL